VAGVTAPGPQNTMETAEPRQKSTDIDAAREAQLASQLVIAQTKRFVPERGLQVQIKYFCAELRYLCKVDPRLVRIQ